MVNVFVENVIVGMVFMEGIVNFHFLTMNVIAR